MVILLARYLFLAASLAGFSAQVMAIAQDPEPQRRSIYISPGGSDSNDGKSARVPMKTFRRAISALRPGDELVLLDGEYSDSAGTGVLGYQDAGAGNRIRDVNEIPSGKSAEVPTVVRALNPGNVTIAGRLVVGRSGKKGEHIRISGITFRGGGVLFNTKNVTIKDSGFHGSFGIGTNDHPQGNELNLIEDVWIWASGERIVAFNYRANRNVWRRVIVRGDGCGKASCSGSGNPNVGITVYDSSEVSLQNVMVIDRLLMPSDSPYADFAVAQHTPGAHHFGRSEWLGTISLKSPDNGYYFEPDAGGIVEPTVRIQDAIAWDSSLGGFNLARAGGSNILENLTIRALGGDGIRIAPELTSGILRNVISIDAGRFGINSKYPFSHVNVHNTRAGSFNQTRCQDGCNFQNSPLKDGRIPSLRYLVRIEEGSTLKGRGYNGSDIGANVIFRYGRDGSRYGEKGFNQLSEASLWPWPNEERIKREMCEQSRVSRGFCSAESLTKYVWEYLGNRIPQGIYR